MTIWPRLGAGSALGCSGFAAGAGDWRLAALFTLAAAAFVIAALLPTREAR